MQPVGEERAMRSRNRLRQEIELTLARNSAIAGQFLIISTRHFRSIVMRGFNCTAGMAWSYLILESTLSG